MNFRIAISKSHLSKLVVAFVSILLFEFLIRDYAVLLMSNVRTEGSFAPASPHKASTGSGLSANDAVLLSTIFSTKHVHQVATSLHL